MDKRLNWQTHEKVIVLPELKLNLLWISTWTVNVVGGFSVEGLAVSLKIRFCDFLGSDTKLRTDGPTDMTYAYGVLFCFVTKAPPPKKKILHVACCYSTSVNEKKVVIRLNKKTHLCT